MDRVRSSSVHGRARTARVGAIIATALCGFWTHDKPFQAVGSLLLSLSRSPHNGAPGSPTEIEAANAMSDEIETALAIQAQAHAILALAAATAIDPGWQRHGDVAGVRYSTS
jgi:hypothetical protein